MFPTLSFVFGFLLGSIPSGFLVARAKGVDIRQHGSGNIGSTNVLRTLGKGPGYFVFACDALKGVAAVLLARWLVPGNDLVAIGAAVACVLGHNYTPWLGFKGGKGVATSLGVLIALVPLASAIVFGLWALLFLLTRYVSLASVLASAALPAVVWWLRGVGPMFWFALAIGLLAIFRHLENIRRLLAGTESRFERKKESES
ncbi:MAG: glycerol-3-phosphate 1-O-acyltransferase PlsY [Verrucomicrobia bacterium]|nr:glycerol-3-phosphate 1-O-acyltransferase PlsY [Verrucomicrobiota bacterium]